MKRNLCLVKNSRSLCRLTLMLGAVSLAALAHAAADGVVETAAGPPFVSGGVGMESMDRMTSLASDFNLKLVCALKSGGYVSGVRVAIASAAGKPLLDTVSQGPWLMTQLPAGNYQVVASFTGNQEIKQVTVLAARLTTLDFRWAGE